MAQPRTLEDSSGSGQQDPSARRDRKTLKALRAERGWTQLDLAARLQIAISTVSAIETGRHQPRLTTARQIAELFGIGLDDIEWSPSPSRSEPDRPTP